MSQIARIKRNSFFALLTHFIRLFANFFVFVGIARLYGPVEFGQFTAAHTLAGIFLLLADYGFDSLLVTEIAHHKDDAHQIIQKLFSMKMVFAVLATVLMIVVASFETVSPVTKTLMYFFSLYVLLSAIINFFFFLFRGYEEFHLEAKISLVMNSFLLVIIIVLSVIHVSLFVIAGTFIGTRLIGIFFAARNVTGKLEWKKYHFSFVNKADFLKINVFGLYGIFGTILFLLDTTLLAFLTSDLQVGLYQSVIKLASLGLIISDILVYSILPSLSQYYNGDYSHWLKLAKYSHRTLMFVGMFIAFFMIVFPADIITLVYGPNRYDAAVPIMRIFGCVVFIRYCSEAGGLLLTSSHQQFQRLIVVVIATVFNFVANLLIIPLWGIVGAAIVAIVTNLIVGIGYLYYSRTFREIWLLDVVQYIPFIVAIFLGLLFWEGRSLNILISLPVSMIVILAAVLFVGFNKVERYKLITWKNL